VLGKSGKDFFYQVLLDRLDAAQERAMADKELATADKERLQKLKAAVAAAERAAEQAHADLLATRLKLAEEAAQVQTQKATIATTQHQIAAAAALHAEIVAQHKARLADVSEQSRVLQQASETSAQQTSTAAATFAAGHGDKKTPEDIQDELDNLQVEIKFRRMYPMAWELGVRPPDWVSLREKKRKREAGCDTVCAAGPVESWSKAE